MVYMTRGVCSKTIEVELDGETIKHVKFHGGCPGNLKGISQLVVGMDARDVIKKLPGTTCGYRDTSCPDQLSIALEQALNENS